MAQIADGTLLKARKLPPERVLAEQFKVSRGVIREALSALQMAGIIDRQVGDGTYLSEDVSAERLQTISERRDLHASIDVVEAIEAREAIDLAVINLAIENAKASDLEVLDKIMERMKEAVAANDIRTYLPLTLDLHIAIAKAGGNSCLVQVVIDLVDLIRPSLWIIEKNYTRLVAAESLQVHQDMVDAVRARSRRKARAAVLKHYHEYPSLQR